MQRKEDRNVDCLTSGCDHRHKGKGEDQAQDVPDDQLLGGCAQCVRLMTLVFLGYIGKEVLGPFGCSTRLGNLSGHGAHGWNRRGLHLLLRILRGRWVHLCH